MGKTKGTETRTPFAKGGEELLNEEGVTVIELDLALPMVVLLPYVRRHWGQRGHCNGVVEEIVKGGLVYHGQETRVS